MKRPRPPFRVLYNNDTTNVSCPSPWHDAGEAFREEHLVASIEEVAAHGVDVHLLSPGLGWVPWWQSDVCPDHYPWWMERTGLEPDPFGRYVLDGGDMVQALIDTCRRRGMAPFVSYRLNDVHHQENYNETNARSALCCRFYVEHPEYLIDPDHKRHRGYYKRRGQNWAIPEVREYKFRLLEELCTKYDLDGFELDFLRDDTLFRQDETTEPQRVQIVTEFVARVRDALDRGSKAGRRRPLGVRIPMQLAAHGAIGLDVRRLYEAGVDMFNLSSWYHTAQRTDLAEARQLVPDAAIYLEMTHSTGWYPHFLRSPDYGTVGDVRTSDHQFYTTAHLAYERGADGISLFNFVYYRTGYGADIPVMEPPFHVLDKLRDPAWLARGPQQYMITSTSYHRQLPRPLASGTTETFQMDMAPPAGSPGATVRLRVHAKQPITPGHRLTACVNGAAATPTEDISRFHGNPFDGMISPLPHRRAWTIPGSALRDGLNQVEVALAEGADLELLYIDCAVE